MDVASLSRFFFWKIKEAQYKNSEMKKGLTHEENRAQLHFMPKITAG